MSSTQAGSEEKRSEAKHNLFAAAAAAMRATETWIWGRSCFSYRTLVARGPSLWGSKLGPRWAFDLDALAQTRRLQPQYAHPLLRTEATETVAATAFGRVWANWDAATHGGPAAAGLVLVGPEGIGKTRVLQSVARVGEALAPKSLCVYVPGADLAASGQHLAAVLAAGVTNKCWHWPETKRAVRADRDLEWPRDPVEHLELTLHRVGARLTVLLDDVEKLWTHPRACRATRALVARWLDPDALSTSACTVLACTSRMGAIRTLAASLSPGTEWAFVRGGLPTDLEVVYRTVRSKCLPNAKDAKNALDLARSLLALVGSRPQCLQRFGHTPPLWRDPLRKALESHEAWTRTGLDPLLPLLQRGNGVITGAQVKTAWGCEPDSEARLWALCDAGLLVPEWVGTGVPQCTHDLRVHVATCGLLVLPPA